MNDLFCPGRWTRGLVFFVAILMGCSAPVRRGENPDGVAKPEPKPDQGPATTDPDLPEQIRSTADPDARFELPIESDQARSDIEAGFAVWVDGFGFDAFEAIGFLQTLERQGLRPQAILGTGFGCAAAMAWAIENKGNHAEWTLLKWDAFSHQDDKRRSREFDRQVSRMLPTKKMSELRIPVDCPHHVSQRLYSSRRMAMDETLWWQLRLPQWVDADLLATDRIQSGVLASVPTPEELARFHQYLGLENKVRTWIVVSTWNRSLSQRQSQTALEQEGNVQDNVRYFWLAPKTPASIASRVPRERFVTEALNAKNRRRFILQGRDRGSMFLESVKSP